jgi:hypothetical protein
MKRRIGALSATLLLASLSLGCMHNPSEEFKGEAYTTLKEQQIANPGAGEDAQPIEGIASTTADHVSANYHKSQRNSHDRDSESTLKSMARQ